MDNGMDTDRGFEDWIMGWAIAGLWVGFVR